MIQFIFNLFNKIQRAYTPRYTLKLCERQYDKDTCSSTYKLLAFGEQRPISLSAKDLLSRQKLKELIAPDDLLSIYAEYWQEEKMKSQYSLKEINRDGTYLLIKGDQKVYTTGEDFCNKPWLIDETNSMDAFRIISETYFKVGRIVEQQLHLNISVSKDNTNVVKLTMVK